MKRPYEAIKDALIALYIAHFDRCISSDKCKCIAHAEEIEVWLNETA